MSEHPSQSTLQEKSTSQSEQRTTATALSRQAEPYGVLHQLPHAAQFHLQQQGDAYARQHFGPPNPAGVPLKSALSQLCRHGNQYVDGRPRLPCILGLCYYAGDLRLYPDRAIRAGQGDVTHFRNVPLAPVPAGARFEEVLRNEFTYRTEKECQSDCLHVSIDEGGQELWRGISKPDGCIAPPAPPGPGGRPWPALVTGETACERRLMGSNFTGVNRVWERLKVSTSTTHPRSVPSPLASCCRSWTLVAR